jgi:hypothetical protein
MPLSALALSVTWFIAVALGIYEYGRSKGRIGRALTVTLGGGLLATFIITPSLLTESVPGVFKTVIEWAIGQVNGGGGG